MTDSSTTVLLEFRLTQAEEHIEKNEALIKEMREEYQKGIQELKDAHEQEKRSQLKWGVSALGSLVTIFGGIIWAYRSVIFRTGS